MSWDLSVYHILGSWNYDQGLLLLWSWPQEGVQFSMGLTELWSGNSILLKPDQEVSNFVCHMYSCCNICLICFSVFSVPICCTLGEVSAVPWYLLWLILTSVLSGAPCVFFESGACEYAQISCSGQIFCLFLSLFGVAECDFYLYLLNIWLLRHLVLYCGCSDTTNLLYVQLLACTQ